MVHSNIFLLMLSMSPVILISYKVVVYSTEGKAKKKGLVFHVCHKARIVDYTRCSFGKAPDLQEAAVGTESISGRV